MPGQRFKPPQTLRAPEAALEGSGVHLGDINGNGSLDVAWSTREGLYYLDLAGAIHAGLMAHMDNGLGLRVSFAYASSHELASQDAAKGESWREQFPLSLPVVVQKTLHLQGAGAAERVVQYHVWDGLWDARERRFGGFLGSLVKIPGEQPEATRQLITSYYKGLDEQRVLRGKPLTVQIQDGKGERLYAEEHLWQTMSLPGYPATDALRKAILQGKKALYFAGETFVATATEFEYDLSLSL
jgi:hypothetical protein